MSDTAAALTGGALRLGKPGGGQHAERGRRVGPIGVPRFVSVTARDAYGNVATSDNGTVHFTSSDPQTVLPPDTNLLNGSGSAFVTLMTVGTQSLTATDTANPALNGTETGVVGSPAAPASLTITGFPATTAGATQNFTVTVKNTIGGVATGYTGTVFFNSSDVQAGLPASYTFTAADAGVHTFSATLKTAGTQSISAHDTLNFTVNGSEQGIKVTPAAAASFVVAGSVSNAAGVSQTYTVTARDAYGNLATNYTGTVHFSSTDVQAGLPADYTFTAADAGAHAFSVTFKTAAKQTLTVQDTANLAASGSLGLIDVAAGVATQLSISAPNSVTAGTAFSVKVTAVDAFGNEASNYVGTVHFTSTAASAVLPADFTFSAADNGIHTFTFTLSSTGAQTHHRRRHFHHRVEGQHQHDRWVLHPARRWGWW